MPHDHDHHHDHGVHLDEEHWSRWADHAELEGEVLLGFVTDAAALAGDLRGPDAPPVRRILDIGSGPGVGTCELARAFPQADVVAVDPSPAMLERARRRAGELGLADRVTAHEAELPGGIAGLGPADLIWASMSLHHVGDEVAALRELGTALAPGGLLAIAELAEPTRVLPPAFEDRRPGLRERIEAAWGAWFADMRAGLPGAVPSGDHATMLADAGFEVLADRVLAVSVDAPLDERTGQLARRQVEQARSQLTGYADPDDLDAIAPAEALIDELGFRAARRILVARLR